jgi:hypothetical protein
MALPKGKGEESKPSSSDPKVEIEMAAYYRWLNRGCPIGDDLNDWVEAEKDVKVKKGKKK